MHCKLINALIVVVLLMSMVISPQERKFLAIAHGCAL